MLSHFNHIQLCATPWTVAHQAALFIGFSRQEYWSGLPCCPPGNLPNLGIKPASPESPALLAILYHWATAEAPPQSIICPQLERCLIWLPAESRPEWLTGLCHCKGYKTLKTHHLTLVISASLQILERKSQTLIWPPSLLLWQKPQQLSGGKTGKLTLWHTRDEKQEAERRR